MPKKQTLLTQAARVWARAPSRAQALSSEPSAAARENTAEAEIFASRSSDTWAVTHNVVGAVVFAARAVNGVTAVCDPHAVMVIFFAAISAVPASRANVKAGCASAVPLPSASVKPLPAAGTKSEAQREVRFATRTGRTSTGNGFGTRRDLRVAIWDPARDVLGVMTVCPAVASHAVDVENATRAGNDSVMVKDTTADVKEVLVESHRDRRRQVGGATFLKTFKRPQSGGPLARSMKEIACGR